MVDEINNPETEKEDTPEWAKKLQETLADLPNRLKEALTPEQQEAPPENKPVEIVLPQPPEPEEPPQPEEVPEEKPEEKPKKRKLLDWLL